MTHSKDDQVNQALLGGLRESGDISKELPKVATLGGCWSHVTC
jgi:hypothetical protein